MRDSLKQRDARLGCCLNAANRIDRTAPGTQRRTSVLFQKLCVSAPRWFILPAALGALFCAGVALGQVPSWGLGPFVRPAGINPIVRPNLESVFNCPMRGTPIQWEALHTFNPAAVVKDDKVWLYYRAEDNTGTSTIGDHTSRLGLATSRDGLHFERQSAPVFFPAMDAQQTNEWTGGCEDPRLVEAEDGTFVLTYTQWNRKVPRLAVATSKDLIHWTKHGPAFGSRPSASKSGAILSRISDGRLKAAKVQGKYWMYWGEGSVCCASSTDLIHWDSGKAVLSSRKGRFDSALAEGGPAALLTEQGILLLYNGKNGEKDGDPELTPQVYSAGQALFDGQDPTKLLQRTEHPFFKPEEPFERTGQYVGGTTFIEGLVLFHGQWFLYYGCADSFVAVAVCASAGK